MSDLIQILPENVANQIAAGEVVQRPASIVKELMENSIDSGADSVNVFIKDGGKSLVRILDNGCGMSASDAERSFARHATSKIRNAKDLFALLTFGFRGEALASIASVAEVQMRTRPHNEPIGTQIDVAGSSIVDSMGVSCAVGTDISVRNLFFNTPARRKFLKSDSIESKHVITEFQHVALCNPGRSFTLTIDDKSIYNLIPGALHARITAITSRKVGAALLEIGVDSPVVRLSGYIGLPKLAKKSNPEQMFFVNGRYFRSPYLHKAVVNGFNKLLPFGFSPSYFIYVDVDPSRIDVNIHPQKTEIKFEDESVIWQMLSSAVAQSLGRHNIVPMMDFDNQSMVDIPIYNPKAEIPPEPAAASNPEFDPFKSYDTSAWDSVQSAGMGSAGYGVGYGVGTSTSGSGTAPRAWGNDPERAPFTEMIPPGLLLSTDSDGAMSVNPPVPHVEQYTETESVEGDENPWIAPSASHDTEPLAPSARQPQSQFIYQEQPQQGYFELNQKENSDYLCHASGRYIMVSKGDSLMIIDQMRARYRILYEELLARMDDDFSVGQRELFPETLTLSASDHYLLCEHIESLGAMGFDIRDMGGTTIIIYGLPTQIDLTMPPNMAVQNLLEQLRLEGANLRTCRAESLASAMARVGLPRSPSKLDSAQCVQLTERLMACNEPFYTPDGRPVMVHLTNLEIEKRFKK